MLGRAVLSPQPLHTAWCTSATAAEQGKPSIAHALGFSTMLCSPFGVLFYFLFFNITCRKSVGMCQPPALRHCSAAGCVLVAERECSGARGSLVSVVSRCSEAFSGSGNVELNSAKCLVLSI